MSVDERSRPDNRSKIKEYWKEYETYTEKLSNCIRQLSFAEAGVFWILSKNGNNLSDIIVFGFLAIIFCFVFDVFQYYYGQRDYKKFAKECEKKCDEDENIDISKIKKPTDFNEKLNLFFYLKIIALSIASLLLTIQFLRQVLC